MFDTYSRELDGATPEFAEAPVVELRQYTLKPGARDTLIEVFERELVESQEAVGMRLGGLFRDRDDADRFVWMRAFGSMAARREALTAFYGGRVWAEHGSAANATMIDSDDVLLLRPTVPARAPMPPARPRVAAGVGDETGVDEWVLMTAYPHDPGAGFCEWFAADVVPAMEQALLTRVATWRTEPAPNSFPGLPVRDEHVVVWAATFTDEEACVAGLARLEGSAAWRAARRRLETSGVAPERLRLAPTARSQHPGARI